MEQSGWADLATGNSTPTEYGPTTQYLTYDREFCATEVETQSDAGLLTTQRTLFTTPALGDALHCLHDTETVSGRREPDATPDFTLSQQVERNALGQIEKVTQLGRQGPLVMQEVGYDALHRVSTVSRPGEGATTVGYHFPSGLLERVTAPDGVVTRVGSFDPLVERPESLVTERKTAGAAVGPDSVPEVFSQYFRYDGMERYAKSWNSVTASSEAAPLESVGYFFPTVTTLGAVEATQLVEPDTGIRRTGASVISAAGDATATLGRIPEGWAVSDLSTHHRELAEVRGYSRGPLPGSLALASLTREALVPAGSIALSTGTSAGFGHSVQSEQTLQEGVLRSEVTNVTLALDPVTAVPRLVTATTENGAYATQAARDMSGNLVWVSDEKGATTRFVHDALDRLVEATLPNGARHERRFDDYGRVASITREGVGSITFGYHPQTGKLSIKTFKDDAGTTVRTVVPSYDAIGRVVRQVVTDAVTGNSRAVSFTYDGALAQPIAGQLGRLTRVQKDGYQRTEVFNPDGTLRQRRVRLANRMEVTWDYTYHADGSTKHIDRVVRDSASGEVVQRDRWDIHHDDWGRLRDRVHNGQALARYFYDGDGRIGHVVLPGNATLTRHYDDVTRRQRGYALNAGVLTSGVDWKYSPRGLIEKELLRFGTEGVERTYGYDAARFLESQTDTAMLPTPGQE